MTSTRLALLAVTLSLIAFGCSKSPLGEACSSSDACESGLSCIQNGGYSLGDAGITCDANDRLCSIPCAVDADCASLGSGIICVDDCFGGSCLTGTRG